VNLPRANKHFPERIAILGGDSLCVRVAGGINTGEQSEIAERAYDCLKVSGCQHVERLSSAFQA